LRTLFLVLSSLLLSEASVAQLNLSGRIVDVESGEPLPYVSVVNAESKKGVSTNIDGYFNLLNIKSDTSSILISYIGYGVAKLKLTKADFEGLKTIEISSKSVELRTFELSEESPQTIQVSKDVSRVSLNPAQIMNLPSLGEVDIFRSLQLLPGVSGTSESSAGLYVRGGTPDQNLILLDGINVYHVDHFFGIFSPFNAFAIKDVQFYKGGFPAEFGGRLSSVVDITSKEGNNKRPSVGINANMLSLNAVIESPLPKKMGSILIAGRRSFTDFIESPTYTKLFNNVTEEEQDLGFGFAGVNTVNPDFYFYDLNGKITLTPSDLDVITFSYFNSFDKLDNSNEQSFGDFGKLKTTDLTDWGNNGYSTKWSRQWTPKLHTRALLSYSKYSSNYELTNGFYGSDSAQNDTLLFQFKTVQKNTVEDAAFRYDITYQLNDKNELKGGLWYTYNQISYLNILDDTINLQDRFESSNMYAFYLQDRMTLNKWVFEGGLRGTIYSKTNQFYLEPRFSFNYEVSKRFRLKGAWGIYRQFVNRVILENIFGSSRDFWLLSDGNTLPVSMAHHYILGTAYETKDWLIDIEAYQKKMTGLVEYSTRFGSIDDTNENFDDLFFRGKGVARGVDILLQRKFGALTGWLSYTLADVIHTFPEINQGKEFYALHDQRHEIKLIVTYKLGKFDIAGNFVFATGKPFTAPVGQYFLTMLDGTSRDFIHFGDKNSQRLPNYHRADVSITYNLKIKAVDGRAGISFFNIYNRKNIKYKRYFLQEFDPGTFMPIEPEIVETDVLLLGFVPNLFLSLTIK
tara:strand:- start:1004 stop:3397 length:2394 start_codon:yes stop_codon:yes gene_type:complete